MTIDSDTVTLVAAVIAATTSLAGLFVGAISERQKELRETNRKGLEPVVVELGEALHQIVASSTLSVRDEREQRRDVWAKRARESQVVLRRLRPKLRYQLWGLDEGFRVLIRLPDWITRKEASNLDTVIDAAYAVKEALDDSIRNCYRYGRPPTLRERMRVNRRVTSLREVWKLYRKTGKTDDSETDEMDPDETKSETTPA